MIKQKINQFNDWLAERMSLVLSMMITFWIILFLVILPLFYGAPTSVVLWAQYASCTIFQAIALPVLGYTSKKASDKSDKMLEEMYKMTQKIEQLVEIIEAREEVIEGEVEEILNTSSWAIKD